MSYVSETQSRIESLLLEYLEYLKPSTIVQESFNSLKSRYDDFNDLTTQERTDLDSSLAIASSAIQKNTKKFLGYENYISSGQLWLTQASEYLATGMILEW